ncbi:MAG: efflux RND transporter periplasmic adaptor subunit [Nitrospirae bacterium]|nr:efflux RND transporter periplasmic adaptor subunit [Nitrospirota bacterium]
MDDQPDSSQPKTDWGLPGEEESAQSDIGESALVLTAEPLRPLAEGHRPVPPPRKRFRLGLALSVAGGTIVAGAVLWYWLSPGEPPVRYKTVPVDRGPITAVVTATGTVNPVISVQVGSQVTGKIKALYADFNSVVTQGEAIAQIDPASFQARVNQARASLRNAQGALVKAQAALAQRKLELGRSETLRRQQFVSQADLDLARTNFRDAAAQVEVAQAQVDQAKAALSNAELDLGDTTIYSPVNGIVVSRNVDVGQTVAASLQAPTLFVIAQDLTKMQVNANVSESDIGGVSEGKDAEFTVDAYPTAPFKGMVAQVRNAPISIQNVVTYDVVIEVDNRDLRLKPGMTANVSIVTARKDDALRVPNAALRFKPSGMPIDKKKTAVWMSDRAGQPQAVPIKAGIADSQFTDILEGEVREGGRVIVGLEESEEAGQKTLPPGFGGIPKLR